jgi:beta-lactamase class A
MRRPGAPALLLAFALIGLAVTSARAAAACEGPLALREHDAALQARLERALRAARLGDVLDRRQLSVSLADLTHSGAIAYAGIHDDHMVYAASLPKIAILVTLFDRLDRGELPWHETWRWKLQQMINVSSNPEATWAAEQVGLAAIGELMTDPRYCFYEPGVGGLWAGRAFAQGGPTRREPLKGLSHASSSRQAARFYVLLDRGQLVSPYWSRYMRELMSPPGYHHKFVAALEGRRGVRFLARKSGTWQAFHSDSALIQHGHARYVLAALAEHPEGEWLLRTVAQVADDVVMEGSHRSFQARAAARGRRG